MSSDVVPIRRWKNCVPKEHRTSLDTRLRWLWSQRFGTVQRVYVESQDLLDRTAATLVLQAIMAQDLRSIQQLFQRLEGGAVHDDEIADDDDILRI